MPEAPGKDGSRALECLQALEKRLSATTVNSLHLDPPPRPLPRRKQPFVLPPQPAVRVPRGPAEAKIVLDGFVLLEAARVEDPAEAEKVVLEWCGISSVVTDNISTPEPLHC